MLITAAITTYKRPEGIRRALKSVLNQTYSPLQVIVVEDGAESGLESWLQETMQGQVTYIRHPENRGLAASRNTALSHAKGQYICYLDDDDEWKADKVAKQVQLVYSLSDETKKNLGVVYCGVESRDADNGRLLSVMLPVHRGNLKDAIVMHGLRTLSSTCMFSCEALKRVGGYDEKIRSSIDHDMWMALAMSGHHAEAVDEALVIAYQSRKGRITTDVVSRVAGVRDFTEKWGPAFKELYGEHGGEAYGRRYFTNVIGRLAADSLIACRLSDARFATKAIYANGGSVVASTIALIRLTCRAAVSRIVPRWSFRSLKRVLGRRKELNRGYTLN